MSAAVEVLAPAKVNLTLRILDREPSGFHRLETLFHAVDLHDRIRVEPRGESGIELEVEGPDVGPDEDNLVVRAARGWMEATGKQRGIHVRLDKRIPAGAGLGGGSSDAAATLRALDALFGPNDPALLHEVAAGLGSDVPFFLAGTPFAEARGRGEILTPLPPLPEAAVVLGLPPVHVSTAWAYGRLADARRVHDEGSPPSILPDRPPDDWVKVAELALNDFEEVVVPAWPEVGAALRALRASDALLSLLSGSGGAVFSVHGDRVRAEEVAAAARERAPGVTFVVTSTTSEFPPVVPVS